MTSDLDTLMAEKVMKFSTTHQYFHRTDTTISIYIDDNDKAVGDWNPTTDMNQAMMCVEKWLSMADTNRFNLCAIGLSGDDWTWCVELNSDDATNKSAPLAICLAIKEALGE